MTKKTYVFFSHLEEANIRKISGISAELQQINAAGFDN